MQQDLTPRDRWIAQQVQLLAGRSLARRPRVVTDTSDYMAIDRDHIVDVGSELFLVNLTEKEKRFGLEGEPKFWVKRCLALSSGKTHILKMVFVETFRAQVGNHQFICRRDPDKEAAVLQRFRGDPRFMQGRAARDARGNLVRIIDYIDGEDLITHLGHGDMPHERYFDTVFPSIFSRTVESVRAIRDLHQTGLYHGDIRNDHIFVERGSGRFRWIDFDVNEDTPLFDVWAIGNILHFVVCGGFLVFREALARDPLLSGRFDDGDGSVFFPHRIMNPKKVYPYIPETLNRVLLRFSLGCRSPYGNAAEIAADLSECAAAMGIQG
jgi:hypothetical protein